MGGENQFLTAFLTPIEFFLCVYYEFRNLNLLHTLEFRTNKKNGKSHSHVIVTLLFCTDECCLYFTCGELRNKLFFSGMFLEDFCLCSRRQIRMASA